MNYVDYIKTIEGIELAVFTFGVISAIVLMIDVAISLRHIVKELKKLGNMEK